MCNINSTWSTSRSFLVTLPPAFDCLIVLDCLSYMEDLARTRLMLTMESSLLAVIACTLLTYVWATLIWPRKFEHMRDDACPLPLPPGTMGCPFIGESLELCRKVTSSPLHPFCPFFVTQKCLDWNICSACWLNAVDLAVGSNDL